MNICKSEWRQSQALVCAFIKVRRMPQGTHDFPPLPPGEQTTDQSVESSTVHELAGMRVHRQT
eukprot:6188289-Pleurochrysis_carterae.AAC.2